MKRNAADPIAPTVRALLASGSPSYDTLDESAAQPRAPPFTANTRVNP